MTRAWLGRAALLGGVLAFTIGVMWYYHFRPTLGAFVLVVGWSVLMGAGWLLLRAASAFDLRVAAVVFQAPATTHRRELEQEKKLLLKAIKELEFDREMGKLDVGEAATVIGRYRARAVEIMKELDGEDGQIGDAVYRGVVEREIARRLGKAGIGGGRGDAASKTMTEGDAENALSAPADPAAPAPAPAPSAPSAPEISSPEPSPAVAGVGGALSHQPSPCPACATVNDADAVFCKKCATKLGATA
jgi:hypothetical protein